MGFIYLISLLCKIRDAYC